MPDPGYKNIVRKSRHQPDDPKKLWQGAQVTIVWSLYLYEPTVRCGAAN
jgi:hypothetical protein